MAEAEVSRQKTLRQVTKLVEERRAQLKEKDDAYFVENVPRKDALRDELMDDVIRERFAHQWVGLVQKKAEMYQNETNRMREQVIPALRHILQRYTEHFPQAVSTTPADLGQQPTIGTDNSGQASE